MLRIKNREPFLASALSKSEEETRELGYELMNLLKAQLEKAVLVLALQGDLAAGKTQMVKGLAQALNIEAVINSPTFIIMKEYEKRPYRLIHFDCWRLSEVNPTEFHLESQLKAGTVIAVEWAAPLLPFFKQKNLPVYMINLQILNEQERSIDIQQI